MQREGEQSRVIGSDGRCRGVDFDLREEREQQQSMKQREHLKRGQKVSPLRRTCPVTRSYALRVCVLVG